MELRTNFQKKSEKAIFTVICLAKVKREHFMRCHLTQTAKEETPCDFSTEEKVPAPECARQKASTNLCAYLNKFPLITACLTSGCHPDHFRAGVEMTTDVICRTLAPVFAITHTYTRARA